MTIGLPEPPVNGDEIIDGKRVRLPPKTVYSVLLGSELAFHIGRFTDSKQLGRIAIKGLFHLSANRDRRPDVAFVSYQRWPQTRSVPRRDNAWDVVPNMATEVVSPTDSVEELEKKIDEYFKAGVELIWVVYPTQNTIHVRHSPTQTKALTITDTLDGGPVLPGFRLPLVELFAEPSEDTN
jgi:Uma2 family endonuclease